MTWSLFLGLASVLSVPVEVGAPVRGQNPFEHWAGVIAVNSGGQSLVAYSDRRGDDGSWSNGDNFRLTRVSPAGALLDPGGIELAMSGPQRANLNVASDGTDYLLVWSEAADSGANNIMVAKLAANGSVSLAPTVIATQPMDTFLYPTGLCYDGAHYRYVYASNNNTTGAYGLWLGALSPAGAVVGAASQLSTTASTYANGARLACSAAGGVIAWMESTGAAGTVRAAPLTAMGAGAAGTVSTSGATAVQSLTLAAGSGGYLAVWEETRSGGAGPALVGQVLTAAGARSLPNDLALSAATAGAQRSPVAAFDGTAYRVLATLGAGGSAQANVATIATSGTVSTALTPVSATGLLGTGIACGGGACLAAWQGSSEPGTFLESFSLLDGARIGAGNTALDSPPLHLSLPSDDQTAAALAFDGTTLLVTWLQHEGRQTPKLMMRRQSAAGAWIEPAPVQIADGIDMAAMLTAPLPGGGFAVVFGKQHTPSDYQNDYYAAVISSSGAVTTQATPIVPQIYNWMRALTCNSVGCMFVEDDISGPRAHRFDLTGATVGLGASFGCKRPFLVGDERWCVTAAANSGTGLALQRYDASLAAIGSSSAIDTPNEQLSEGGVIAGVDGSGVTLVWDAVNMSALPGAAAVHMKAALLSTTGAVLTAPVNLFVSADNGWLNAQTLVTGAGGRRWLLWYANDGQLFYQLRVQELSSTLGMLGDLDELTTCGLDLTQAALVATAGGNLALGYLLRDAAPDRGSHRVELRLTTGVPPVGGSNDAGVPSDLDGGGGGGNADGGGGGGDGGGGGGGGGNDGGAPMGGGPGAHPSGGTPSGCACQLGGPAPTSPALGGACALLIAVVLRRRALSRRR